MLTVEIVCACVEFSVVSVAVCALDYFGVVILSSFRRGGGPASPRPRPRAEEHTVIE